jgi:hypothetical protein
VPRVGAAGALGFGAVTVLQNARHRAHQREPTPPSSSATAPVLVALIAVGLGRSATRPVAWSGYALALAGIALLAHAGGGGATPLGDLLVLGSVAMSAALIVAQPRLLAAATRPP